MLSSLLTAGMMLAATSSVSPIKNEQGLALRMTADNPWGSGFYLPLAGNSRSSSPYIDEVTFARAVVTALETWKQASGGLLSYDYWQGTDLATFPAGMQSDGLSTIFFASQNLEQFAPGVPENPLAGKAAAHTQLWIDVERNEIVEIDLVLNDFDYEFVSRLVQGQPRPDYLVAGNPYMVLEDTIAHELGHAYGLDHATPMSSTMFAYGWHEQDFVSCDDVSGIRELYAPPDPHLGQIVGTMVMPDKSPLFGASVTAISARDFDDRVSAVTDRTGMFQIPRLVPGDYYLLVQAIDRASSPLSRYYFDVDHQFCTAANGFPSPFAREFKMDPASGALQRWSVAAGGETRVDSWAVRCGAYPGLEVDPLATDSMDAAPDIWSVANTDFEGLRTVAVVDRHDPMSTGQRWLALPGLAGHVAIRVGSYSLFSGAAVTPVLTDASGTPVAQTTKSPLFEKGDGSEFTNYDASVEVRGLEPGDYWLRLDSSRLDASYFPAGDRTLDETPFFVVSVRANPSGGDLPAPRRCLGDPGHWPSYQLQTGEPRRRGENEIEDMDDGAGCRGARESMDRGLPSWLALVGVRNDRH